jgi:hypothetical protein
MPLKVDNTYKINFEVCLQQVAAEGKEGLGHFFFLWLTN